MKARNKVSPEFSMSSLTDIIFLLLIFFMLTSSMVQVTVELPKSDSKTVAPSDYTVMLTKDGKVSYNGKRTTLSAIRTELINDLKGADNEKNATLAIVSEVGVPWSKVSEVMELANRLRMRAIIATQPRK